MKNGDLEVMAVSWRSACRAARSRRRGWWGVIRRGVALGRGATVGCRWELARREWLIDPLLARSRSGWATRGQVRVAGVLEWLVVVEFCGEERTTRRAVTAAKARWPAGRSRTHRRVAGSNPGQDTTQMGTGQLVVIGDVELP